MKNILPILIAFASCMPLTCAHSAPTWEAAKKQSAAAIDAGDCASAWKLLWPWAKNGQAEARALLASGVLFAGLTPPGGSGDAISQVRHGVILSVHGAAEGDPVATELLLSLIRTELVADIGGRNMKQCMEAAPTSRLCVAQAVKFGFVPDFDAYAKEIDAIAALPGAASAACQPVAKNDPIPLPHP